MRTTRRVTFPKHLRLDVGTLLKGVLIGVLTAAYVLVTYSLVVAVAVLPFGDPNITLKPPAWLLPLYGQDDLLGGFLTIVFGPTLGISVVAASIVLLTTPRAYRWLRAGVDDLVDGQYDDVSALVANVHAHLDTVAAPQALFSTIAATIAQTFKLPYVAIETHDRDAPLEGTFGVLPPEAAIDRLPLRYHDTEIGELRVATRRAGEQLSAADLKVLSELARQVGIALYAAQMTTDLQRSRTRLVTAREEERRRIRRDLHDGLGPTLANFAMRLEQARDSLPPGAEDSAALLAALTGEAQSTITDVRRLVYQLRPPDLDEYGLVSALREYLHRMAPKGMAITLDAPEILPALPAAVEVAAYRIVQEAVNNAIKHAHASAIAVTLALPQEPGLPLSLSVQIQDNGRGLGPEHGIGIGLHSMQERAEELGGTFALQSGENSGTFVAANLPLA